MDKNINIGNLSAKELLRMKKELEQGLIPDLKDINLDNLNLELLDIDNKKYLEELYEYAKKHKINMGFHLGDLSYENNNKEESKIIK